MKKSKAILSAIIVCVLFITVGQTYAQQPGKIKVKITNLTKGVLLTPPIIAITKKMDKLVKPGMQASLEIEKIAEGGDTSDLALRLISEGEFVIEHDAPIPPGEMVEIELGGVRSGYLSIVSMLLPTNDGFVILNSMKIADLFKKKVVYLHAYDSGTEENDEICDNIPGPQCGGNGYVEGGGEGYVYPHPAIHGEADLSVKLYNWSDPVAMVSVEGIK
jgi:hypothetical protein